MVCKPDSLFTIAIPLKRVAEPVLLKLGVQGQQAQPDWLKTSWIRLFSPKMFLCGLQKKVLIERKFVRESLPHKNFSGKLSEMMFQFPITSLWQDCHLRVAFMWHRVKELWSVPGRLPRYVAGSTWSLQLRVTSGGDCGEFFERNVFLQTQTWFLWRARCPMRDCIDRFCAFFWKLTKLYR